MTTTHTEQPPTRTSPLPASAHTEQPWRLHDVARDFYLEDVWALPMRGGPDDLASIVDWFVALDEKEDPLVNRVLLAIRFKLGALLGLDSEESGIKARVPSLRDRLPDDLATGPTGPDLSDKPFQPVYLTDREWVAEIANQTCHALVHFGWVPDGDDRWHAQMAVLVKPNGTFGRAYMDFIKPFRYLIVYPALLRNLDRRWASREPAA
ncbi:DUF2867 domain-containing protein [Nocardioides sp.]|uniref:DUF2867 domain-containing protein n=1 Tax=Nocardioides sp. TaxID=35761 RepID=UPI002B7A47D8|nr:DUF2867 domain-containing protein [Nocardioides sp.]HXH78850.1 DUF2867 domain-containing protein [Nocardioides sp.]